MMTRKTMIFVGLTIVSSLLLTATTSLSDTLTTSPLKDSETLISAGGAYALGFFSPNNSSGKRYLAVWYNNISSHYVVWVANPRSPVGGSVGSLGLTPNGTLLVFDQNNTITWSALSTAKTTTKTAINPTAQLLDTGNLIVRDDAPTGANDNNYIWQSFDYPSNTMLPGMFVGWELRTGLNRNLTSWVSPTDPSPGQYTFAIDLGGVPQIIVTHDHSLYFRGEPEIGDGFVPTTEEVGYYYEVANEEVSMLKINSNGTVQQLKWIDQPRQWSILFESMRDKCDEYSFCGPFGTCNASESTYCSCLWGFRPKNPARWVLRDWRDGCMRNTAIDCRNGKGTGAFATVSGVKLPDSSAAVAEGNLRSDECRVRCLTNCSCTSYARADDGRGGSCVMWTGELDDLHTDNE